MTDPWRRHGGGVTAAARRYGGGDWLDLSTGVNPHAWPGAASIGFDWRPLPDIEALARLEAAAAAFFGCDAAHVCALPGAELGLRLVGEMLVGATRYVFPTYGTHAEMAEGAEPVAIADIASADASNLILANPNNPDGRLLDGAALTRLVARRAAGRWVVVDESFADADPVESLAADVADDRPLAILRSFGKFFGLAGVRLGFMIGPRPLVARLRRRLGAWPVSAAALAIGAAAYDDVEWIAAMRTRLRADAGALDAVMTRAGLRPVGACPLFRLVETPDASKLFERLAAQAILTRPFDYAPHWLRVGLPGDERALRRLESALAHG